MALSVDARYRRRRAARAVWAAGGRLAEVAERERVRLGTLRQWLMSSEFRVMLAEEAMESVMQAASAVVRWAPAAVARLIKDLDSESASDAHRAAREIIRLAMDVQRQLAGEAVQSPKSKAQSQAEAVGAEGPAEDPLSRQVAELSDEAVESILGILNGDAEGRMQNGE